MSSLAERRCAVKSNGRLTHLCAARRRKAHLQRSPIGRTVSRRDIVHPNSRLFRLDEHVDRDAASWAHSTAAAAAAAAAAAVSPQHHRRQLVCYR